MKTMKPMTVEDARMAVEDGPYPYVLYSNGQWRFSYQGFGAQQWQFSVAAIAPLKGEAPVCGDGRGRFARGL